MTLAAMTYYLLFLILGLPIGVWCAGAWLCKDRGGVLGLITWILLMDKESGR